MFLKVRVKHVIGLYITIFVSRGVIFHIIFLSELISNEVVDRWLIRKLVLTCLTVLKLLHAPGTKWGVKKKRKELAYTYLSIPCKVQHLKRLSQNLDNCSRKLWKCFTSLAFYFSVCFMCVCMGMCMCVYLGI